MVYTFPTHHATHYCSIETCNNTTHETSPICDHPQTLWLVMRADVLGIEVYTHACSWGWGRTIMGKKICISSSVNYLIICFWGDDPAWLIYFGIFQYFLEKIRRTDVADNQCEHSLILCVSIPWAMTKRSIRLISPNLYLVYSNTIYNMVIGVGMGGWN